MFDYMTLKLIVWGLVGLFLIVFALTDGFDLGIGTLLPFVAKDDMERRIVVNTIGPIWEGQQVWLIAAGTSLFAAWPLAYATSFSAFYLVLLILLWTLFLRPICFDYRSKLTNPKWRFTWDWTLFVASTVPVIIFGAAFGNLLLGVDFHFNNMMQSFYTGTFLKLLHPFAVLCGLVSLTMLIMHGGYYLNFRTSGAIAYRARVGARIAAVLYIVLFSLAGYCIAFMIDGYKVIELPGSINSVLLPLGKIVDKEVGAWMGNYTLYPWTRSAPIIALSAALFSIMLSYFNWAKLAFISSGFAVAGTIMTAAFSLFPFVLPSSSMPAHGLTVWDAVAGEFSLKTIVWVNILVLPVVTVYVAWVYKKLSGPITVDAVKSQDKTLY